jgi:hypothetical protein
VSRCVTLLVFLIFWLLCVPTARAGDYAVAYALDVGGRQETGIVEECRSQASCSFKFRTQAISIELSSIGRDDKVSITIFSSQPGCCFFYGGSRSISRDIGSLVGLYLYEGHKRKGNEFVENLHFGTLFLRFSRME